MERRRRIAWGAALVGACSSGVCGYMMARRVATFHRERPREVYAFKAVTLREFEYAGRAVSIRHDEAPGGTARVIVRYGDEEMALSSTLRSDPRLPGLLAYEDWMRLLRFASATGTTLDRLQEDMETGAVRDRLVLVTRTPEPGADPGSWGEVNKKAWTFDFHEFLPEGGFAHERKRFPLKRRADLRTGEVPPPPADELTENTWQFQAALMVMPPARTPGPQFKDDALHAMGWTLPATSLSILTTLGAIIVAASPRRRGRG